MKSVEKQQQVMKHALELVETIQEGIIHIKNELISGKFSETMNLFEDVVLAFTSVESAINQLDEDVKTDQLVEATEKVKKAIELVVDQYEIGNRTSMQEIMQFTLGPSVKQWRTEMENNFHPYILN